MALFVFIHIMFNKYIINWPSKLKMEHGKSRVSQAQKRFVIVSILCTGFGETFGPQVHWSIQESRNKLLLIVKPSLDVWMFFFNRLYNINVAQALTPSNT